MRAAFVVLVFLWGIRIAHADDWKLIDDDRGVTVEQREVPGAAYGEIRVRASSKLTPEQVFETIWKHHEYPQFMPNLKHLKIVKEQSDVRWVYQQVSVPVVSDREYTLRVTRQLDSESHVYQAQFETDHPAGPPPNPDFTRVKLIRGSWTVEPKEGGGTDLTYRIFSDPGVSLPRFVIENAQKKATANAVRAMLERAAKTH